MSLDENVSAFIGRLYESACDQKRWDECAKELMRLTNAHFFFYSTFDTRNPAFNAGRAFGADDSKMANGFQEYFAGRYVNDPSLIYALEHPGQRFCDTRDVVPDPAKNEYMQWTKAHFGSTHWLVGYASDDDGITFGASLHAHHTVGPLPERDARLFRMLFDHMERAVRLAARPPSLANSDEALIYLGRDGRVLAMSPLAETIIGLADGISLQDGRLGTAASDTTVRLDKAVRCAVDALVHGGSGETVSICRPSGRRAWLVSAVPYFAPTSMASPLSPAAIVRIREQCGVRPVQAELFGLTPREAEVASLLAEGHSLESLACILGMARNTGRIHLQALFRKTGTNRQADLVRALLA